MRNDKRSGDTCQALEVFVVLRDLKRPRISTFQTNSVVFISSICSRHLWYPPSSRSSPFQHRSLPRSSCPPTFSPLWMAPDPQIHSARSPKGSARALRGRGRASMSFRPKGARKRKPRRKKSIDLSADRFSPIRRTDRGWREQRNERHGHMARVRCRLGGNGMRVAPLIYVVFDLTARSPKNPSLLPNQPTKSFPWSFPSTKPPLSGHVRPRPTC